MVNFHTYVRLPVRIHPLKWQLVRWNGVPSYWWNPKLLVVKWWPQDWTELMILRSCNKATSTATLHQFSSVPGVLEAPLWSMAIFWVYIPLHRPYRILKWPLMWLGSHIKHHQLLIFPTTPGIWVHPGRCFDVFSGPPDMGGVSCDAMHHRRPEDPCP